MPKTKKVKRVSAENAMELADILGLSPADGAEIEFSIDLNNKIIEIIEKTGLTHVEVARLTGIGRTKITGIMNRNLYEISIKTLIRVLAGLGYKVSPKISKVA